MDNVPTDEEIDEMHARSVSCLLATPTPEQMQGYYSKLAKSNNYSGIEVEYIGSTIGKGVFSTRSFAQDELLLKEHMLVGGQHTHNKGHALVCSSCFCFIGSIEVQIGKHLLSAKQLEADDASVATSSELCESNSLMEAKEKKGFLRARADGEAMNKSSPDNARLNNVSLSLIDSLLSERLRLPYSELFPLPPAVKCVGGCEEELFCSETCARSAWESHHSLLCTGPKSLSKNRDLLCEFKHHADETNDIFHVAAKVISSTILSASKLENKDIQQGNRRHQLMGSLLKAWEPFSMGYKHVWWESVALPMDLNVDDEMEFRDQIKQLCSRSLELLKGAIFEEDYVPLFSLQVYGNIIGMFELNNLDLVVASPVEDYFIFIDELPASQKMEAMKVTRPLLDALGDDYGKPCQGTAFFPVQSCINHSCCPNVKAFKRDEDKDGQAVLLAMRPIKKGEEITLSYIDESSSWEERKTMLEDYGFVCKCDKCLKESTLCVPNEVGQVL